jgi:hypothetical protein
VFDLHARSGSWNVGTRPKALADLQGRPCYVDSANDVFIADTAGSDYRSCVIDVTGTGHRVRQRDSPELNWPCPVRAASVRSRHEDQRWKARSFRLDWDRRDASANAHDACEATRRELMAHHRARNEWRPDLRQLRETSAPPDYRARGTAPCPRDASRSRDFDQASLQRRIGSALLVSLSETPVGGMPLRPGNAGLVRARRSRRCRAIFLRALSPLRREFAATGRDTGHILPVACQTNVVHFLAHGEARGVVDEGPQGTKPVQPPPA